MHDHKRCPGGLAFYASKHRRQQFWLLSNRQPGDPHLQVGDGEVDYKGGGSGVLVLPSFSNASCGSSISSADGLVLTLALHLHEAVPISLVV